jgi:hypothetical protein
MLFDVTAGNLFNTCKFSKKSPTVNDFFRLIISTHTILERSGLSILDGKRSELYGLWVG